MCVDVLILKITLLAFEGSILYLLMFHLNYLKNCHLLLFFGSHFMSKEYGLIQWQGLLLSFSVLNRGNFNIVMSDNKNKTSSLSILGVEYLYKLTS